MNFYQRFYPKKVYKNVLEITPEFLQENNIKAVLLDIDNTLINYNCEVLDGIENWIKSLKENKIKICILSNTRKKYKAEKMAKLLDVPYINFAKKPLKNGFEKAKRKLNIENSKEIAAIGDQIMTDIYGANRCNIFSILVEPIDSRDILITRFNRILERRILKKYYDK